MALDKRIIAIQMLPTAYDEIQRLKGEETWTRFIIECVLAKVGNNDILQGELESLIKAKDVAPPKAEKPKKVKKAKVEKEAKTKVTGEEREPTEAEVRAIEAEAPTGERVELTKAELRAIEELAPIK